jgi:negative regulator of genetic competence, sporulation and motility
MHSDLLIAKSFTTVIVMIGEINDELDFDLSSKIWINLQAFNNIKVHIRKCRKNSISTMLSKSFFI